jgi:hypothetical protein
MRSIAAAAKSLKAGGRSGDLVEQCLARIEDRSGRRGRRGSRCWSRPGCSRRCRITTARPAIGQAIDALPALLAAEGGWRSLTATPHLDQELSRGSVLTGTILTISRIAAI